MPPWSVAWSIAIAVVEQALHGAAELAAVGVEEGHVVEAGVAAAGGGVPPALSHVFRPMWWW